MTTITDPQDAIDAPAVTRSAAHAAVANVLAGITTRAFGRDADDWRETLLDELSDVRDDALLAILCALNPSPRRRAEEHLVDAIHRHATNWLAEADSYELDLEGFPCP